MKSNLNKYSILWILFVFSIVIYQFVNSGFYSPLVYTMYFAPLLYLFKRKYLDKSDLSLIGVFVMMLSTDLVHPETFRISTVAYSGLFFITFLLYKSLCRSGCLDPYDFRKFLSYIIFAFAAVIILQQIQVTLGLPVFNKQPWSFENRYKLNSLSMEPSNTLLIMPVLMFSYVKLSEVLNNKGRYILLKDSVKDKYVWLAFLYVCLTTGSLTVFFSLTVFLIYFLRKRALIMVPIVVLLGITALVLLNPESQLLGRFLSLTQSLEGGSGSIIDKDVSASVRIVPYIEFYKSFDPFGASTWLGHGVDQFEINSTRIILGAENSEHRNIGAKSILALFYDHGIIAGILFLYFLLKNTAPRFLSFETLFYTLIFSVITLNHYILWLYMMLMFTNQYFKSINKSRIMRNSKSSSVYANRY